MAVDHPAEAFGDERGDPRALGLDLEWEATAAAEEAWRQGSGPGYAQPCVVNGEVLVGSRRIDIAGVGWRSHQWGVRDWWPACPWTWMTGHLDDGTPFAGAGHSAVVGDDGLATAATSTLGGLGVRASPLAHRRSLYRRPTAALSRLDRALCRYDTYDGGGGIGWTDWLSSSGYASE